MKLKRIETSVYETPDGKWRIWREPYHPRFWFVNDTACDETEYPTGFASKREAVEYLEKRIKEIPDSATS